MSKIYEVQTGRGTILFASKDPSGASAYSATTVVQKASETFEEALGVVKELGMVMAERLSGIKCDSTEATFGITLGGKGKFIVAEASAEASVSVKFTFKK